MAPTTSKNKDREEREKEAQRESLPVGHPNAGYTSPDLSATEGAGLLPDEEQGWRDDLNEKREEENEAVAEAENKVVTEEREKREKEAKEAEKNQKEQAKTTTASTTPPSTAKSS